MNKIRSEIFVKKEYNEVSLDDQYLKYIEGDQRKLMGS